MATLSLALKCGRVDGRRGAVDARGEIGWAAAPAVPALLELLRVETNPGVQRFAAEALGQIGTPAIEATGPALADAPPEYAARLAQALGVVGPAAQAGVGPLPPAPRHAGAGGRPEAAWALGRVPPPA